MKYIRTKEGIYETKNVILISPVNYRIVWTQKLNKPWFYINDIKQADTIEELCDEFVYAKCDYMELEEAKQEKEFNESDWEQDGLPIYGAIWTDKGLIYVAKMNEKGELELI